MAHFDYVATSLVLWGAFIAGGIVFDLLVDLIAVVLAFTLIGSKSATDKGNAWVKLSLEGVAFLVAFVNATGHNKSQ